MSKYRVLISFTFCGVVGIRYSKVLFIAVEIVDKSPFFPEHFLCLSGAERRYLVHLYTWNVSSVCGKCPQKEAQMTQILDNFCGHWETTVLWGAFIHKKKERGKVLIYLSKGKYLERGPSALAGTLTYLTYFALHDREHRLTIGILVYWKKAPPPRYPWIKREQTQILRKLPDMSLMR